MATLLDSAAVFRARVRQFDLDGLWEAFGENGWHSWGNFAVSTSWTPGTPDDSEFQKGVVQILLGSMPHPAMCAGSFSDFAARKVKLKRLFVEA